jgi:hypothetical protein
MDGEDPGPCIGIIHEMSEAAPHRNEPPVTTFPIVAGVSSEP